MPYKKEEDMIYVQFGYGDIGIVETKDKETGRIIGIAFYQLHERREIGDYQPNTEGKSLTDVDTWVAFQFDKIESIDVLMDVLAQVKNNMIKQKSNIPAKVKKKESNIKDLLPEDYGTKEYYRNR